MQYCPTCGGEVAEQGIICLNCGMELAPHAPEQGRPELVNLESGESPGALEENLPASAPTLVSAPSSISAPSVPTSSTQASENQNPSSTPPILSPRGFLNSIQAPAGGLARLTVKRGGAISGESFEIGGSVILGRFDPESGPVDIDLGVLQEASYISRHHAALVRDPSGEWSVRDLGSRNGTFVRAAWQTQFQRIQDQQPISDGDEIALGNARFEFHIYPKTK